MAKVGNSFIGDTPLALARNGATLRRTEFGQELSLAVPPLDALVSYLRGTFDICDIAAAMGGALLPLLFCTASATQRSQDMRIEKPGLLGMAQIAPRTSSARGLAFVAIAAAGLIAIVGCGGGGDSNCLSNPDPCIAASLTPPEIATAQIWPSIGTVQAGQAFAFTDYGNKPARYVRQWRRSTDGGFNWVDIVGATGDSYTVSNAPIADDGSRFLVEVRDASGGVAAVSAAARLQVSSLPGVIFEDGEFADGDWRATAIAAPADGSFTHSEGQVATGGIRGAYRRMVHVMPAGPSTLRVLNVKPTAVYDPATQGAIYAIDYSEDCNRLSASFNSMDVISLLLVEQGGRRYVSTNARGCVSLWIRPVASPSLRATDFERVDGPVCAVNESCPDFSAGAAPIQLGFERRVVWPQGGSGAATINHGIDNWKVTIWRR